MSEERTMDAINVQKQDGSSAGSMPLLEGWWQEDRRVLPLIHEVVVYQRAKLRGGLHATKSRNEVSGSGRKMYRQKGTGSARMGDKKPPHRRGGGVAHGPKPHSHAFKVNKKVRKLALRAALCEKLRENALVVVEQISPETHKTKDFSGWLTQWAPKGRVLVVVDRTEDNLIRAAANLPKVRVMTAQQVNVYDLMIYPVVLVAKEAMEALQQRTAV